MNRLISIKNPFEDIELIEIFKREIINSKLTYKVNIDSLITIFQIDNGKWNAMRLRDFVTEDVRSFISQLIESIDLIT